MAKNGRESFLDFLERDPNRLSDELESLGKRVLDSLYEVHKTLPLGLTERTYENALCRELELRGIKYVRQAPVDIVYKGERVGEGYIDVLVEDQLVLELKAVECLTTSHRAQLVYYLAAKNLRLAFLVNFHSAMLKDGFKRVVNPVRS